MIKYRLNSTTTTTIIIIIIVIVSTAIEQTSTFAVPITPPATASLSPAPAPALGATTAEPLTKLSGPLASSPSSFHSSHSTVLKPLPKAIGRPDAEMGNLEYSARALSAENRYVVFHGGEVNGEPVLFNPPLCGSEENHRPGHFTPYDYSVIVTMLAISIGIGVFYGFFNKQEESSDFNFHLGSGMQLFPVTLSLTTSFITAIELLGNPAETFFHGTQFSIIVLAILLVIPVAIKIFYPIYFKLEVTSCYEYLGIRFGSDIRVFGAMLYIVQMTFYTAVAVLAPAIALSKATGLSTRLAVVLIYVVCIFYSSQGGMKAVVIADTFQAMVLGVSLIVIIALGSYYTGNMADVFNATEDRLEFFNFDPSPTTRHSVFTVFIGGFFYWTSMFCTNQACVQKCMSLQNLKSAKLALIYSILGLVVVFVLNFYIGLMSYAQYSDCDPLESGLISAKDQLLPFYIMDKFGHIIFINGLFVAGIFAASLGTVASALNSLSAVTSEDILITGLRMAPETVEPYAKGMSIGYGILSFGLVFIVEKLGGILEVTLTLNGLIGGVTLGLFALGICFSMANTKGALYGGTISLVLVVAMGVTAEIVYDHSEYLPISIDGCDCTKPNATDAFAEPISSQQEVFPLFRMSYMYYSFVGCLLTVLLGLITSLFFNRVQKYQDSKHPESAQDIEFKATATSDKAPKDDKPKCIKVSLLSNSVDHLDGCVNEGMKIDDCC